MNRHLFRIEINGRGILTFDASDLEMAEEVAASSQFQADLMSYETVGGCVWDGRHPMRIRSGCLVLLDQIKDRVDAVRLRHADRDGIGDSASARTAAATAGAKVRMARHEALGASLLSV